jgi:hypothetical protein
MMSAARERDKFFEALETKASLALDRIEGNRGASVTYRVYLARQEFNGFLWSPKSDASAESSENEQSEQNESMANANESAAAELVLDGRCIEALRKMNKTYGDKWGLSKQQLKFSPTVKLHRAGLIGPICFTFANNRNDDGNDDDDQVNRWRLRFESLYSEMYVRQNVRDDVDYWRSESARLMRSVQSRDQQLRALLSAWAVQNASTSIQSFHQACVELAHLLQRRRDGSFDSQRQSLPSSSSTSSSEAKGPRSAAVASSLSSSSFDTVVACPPAMQMGALAVSDDVDEQRTLGKHPAASIDQCGIDQRETKRQRIATIAHLHATMTDDIFSELQTSSDDLSLPATVSGLGSGVLAVSDDLFKLSISD